MVRRSTLDRGPQSPVHGEGFPAAADAPGPAGSPAGALGDRAPTWRGAGGRWLVWLFRAVVWAVLLIIGYRGVTAIVLGETAAPAVTAPAPAPASTFPSALAEAFALQFGDIYLNANPANAARRASDLAAFLPPGSDATLGWNGLGTLSLQSEQVAGIDVRGSRYAVVTLLARVNGRLMELGVPIYSSGGAVVVSGEPAWLAPPSRVALPAVAAPGSDAAVQSVLESQLPAFFEAYASGDQVTLGRFLAPGATVAGLNGTVTFGSLTAVTVPAGGSIRQISATVVWHIPGQPVRKAAKSASPGNLEMTYSLTVERSSGTWYVKAITALPWQPGPP